MPNRHSRNLEQLTKGNLAMSSRNILRWLRGLGPHAPSRRGPQRPPGVRLLVECLEDRLAPATFLVNAGDVSDAGGGFVYAVNQANDQVHNPGQNVISLAAGSTYDFSTADNFWYGPNALPAISSNVVIDGNGAVLRRDPTLPQTAAGALRFFYVSGGQSGL